MSLRLTQNTWEGGLNTDTSKSKLNPVFYTDAHNLDIVAEGDFFSLKNIRGTTKVGDLIASGDLEILGVFANRYLIDDERKECLTIFAATPASFKVWCYDPQGNDTYLLFEEETESDYLTTDRVVDAVGYAENNVEHIYFADDYNEVRVIRCEIPSPYTPDFLTASDISVQRRGANGKITLDSILSGGSLLSGSYQFAYRMVDPINKRFTKWSSLTLPIHVYSATNSTFTNVYSDYGLPTSFKIRIDITPTAEELSNFDYFQVAVVENVYPTGPEVVTDGENQTFVASLLPIEPIASRLNYEHKTNAKVGVVPIEDLVVDLAAIKSARTLSVKQKKLILGGIKYHNLQFDNGDPVTSGSIATRTTALVDLFSSHEESIYRGYFRDEVYRFGIVYFDKFGNRSPVKVLDLNALTNNQISSTLPDVRFPDRSTSNSWTVFDSNSPQKLRSLGLSLTDIHNHPTWAVGFEIVRAKRKKRILSQSPLVPMTYVRGTGALDDYPSQAVTVTGGSPDNEYPEAQPQTTSKVYMPKNLLVPETRVAERMTNTTGSGTTLLKKGEAYWLGPPFTNSFPTLAMLFPQNFMYENNNPFILSGAEKLEAVDYVTMRASVTTYVPAVMGERLDTKMKVTFHALRGGDYYFDPSWAAKTITETPAKITSYTSFENLGEPQTVGGKNVMDYDALLTEGLDYGYKPNVQKSVVVDVPLTNNTHDIVGMKTLTFSNAGTMGPRGGGNSVFSSTAGFRYESNRTNKLVNEYSGFSNGSTFVQALKIVNIVNDYGDDRYGDVDTQHEFISTGAKYYFSEAELTNVQLGIRVDVDIDVWGGDCFVSPHTFKVSDSVYSITNPYKAHSPSTADSSAGLIGRWNKYFLNTGGAAISQPIGLEAVAQFITVILESEYNGGVMAQDLLESSGASDNNLLILTPSGGEEALRAPLTYRYNLNLSKQNDEKVYFTKPEFSFERSDFPARVAYSDQKIYNTDETGFDVFRVLNFLDLEEKHGAIVKLAIESDNLYAIQENGIIGLPVGETQLTTTDAGQLAVGTSEFFGRPIIIDEKRGGQHQKAIVQTGDIIYIPDNSNKAVYVLTNNTLQAISELNNETLFRTLFDTTVDQRELLGLYHPTRKEYWLVGDNYCYIFNEKKKQWITNYEFPQTSGGVSTMSLKGGIFTNLDFYLMGNVDSGIISLYTMYTGAANTLFGSVVTPRVSFVVNPDDAISKKFTNQAYTATERLATADFTVEREQELSDQTITGTVIAVSPKGGNYRIKLSRAAGNERLRGLRMLTTIKWKTDGRYSSLSSVLTKYLHESRVPF